MDRQEIVSNLYVERKSYQIPRPRYYEALNL